MNTQEPFSNVCSCDTDWLVYLYPGIFSRKEKWVDRGDQITKLSYYTFI